MKRLFFFLSVVSFYFVLNVYSTTPASQPQASKHTTPSAGAKRNFDLSVTSLPPTFIGEDLPALVQEIGKRFPLKTEYESDDVYNQRLEEIAASAFRGNVAYKDWLFAVVSNDEFKYQPDRQSFTASYSTDAGMNSRGILIKETFTDLGSYVGQNAMNAKVKISKIKDVMYYLDVENDLNAFGDLYDGRDYLDFDVPVPAQDAPRLKSQLRILWVFSSVAPYLDGTREHVDPTFSDPIDTITIGVYFPAHLQRICVFNFVTGKIYKSYSIMDQTQTSPE